MSDLDQVYADLESHHIEGHARVLLEAGKPGYFKVPLVSHVTGNLWTGGCIDGVRLPDDFSYVVSLYSGERYELGDTTARVELKLYDVAEIPDERQLYDLARIVNAFCATGKTLVHCQAGLNRSGLIAGLALVLQGYTGDEAIDLLRTRRCDGVLCNPAFDAWLRQQPAPERARADLELARRSAEVNREALALVEAAVAKQVATVDGETGGEQ